MMWIGQPPTIAWRQGPVTGHDHKDRQLCAEPVLAAAPRCHCRRLVGSCDSSRGTALVRGPWAGDFLFASTPKPFTLHKLHLTTNPPPAFSHFLSIATCLPKPLHRRLSFSRSSSQVSNSTIDHRLLSVAGRGRRTRGMTERTPADLLSLVTL